MIFLIGIVSASYCCEKTTKGAWCQDVDDKTKCATGEGLNPPAATRCDSTSFCRLGCCFDSQKGTCAPNTAKKTCEDRGGTWNNNADCRISQCEKGCCVLGDYGHFGTLTECKFLSSFYGKEPNFRKSIQDEFECSMLSSLGDRGACVYEEDLVKKCIMTTRGECKGKGQEFHEGILCSSEELGTTCGPSEDTTCYNGKVYFLDSCNNRANIYDANRYIDKLYWKVILGESQSCGYGKNNVNSKTCGNCEYSLGSTCKTYNSRLDDKPQYGNHICRDLSCEYEGIEYKHGESWCAKENDGNEGIKDNLPGSRYFVLSCYEGEVSSTRETCADNRNQICIEEEINGMMHAKCVANLYDDCLEQDNEKDCKDTDSRYCKWIDDIQGVRDLCVPLFSPGNDDYCDVGRFECTVTYGENILGGKIEKDKDSCKKNCYCLEDSWRNKMNDLCTSLGDCGSSKNYKGYAGWRLVKDLIMKG